MSSPARRLPDFPWDTLRPAADRARAHPDGLVDLSIGTPVDPTPPAIQRALTAAADAPGYPSTAGTPQLRAALAGWLANRHGVSGLDPEAVLPVVGSKELVAALPSQLGLSAGDTVAIPALAYPTYEVGALLAGASVVRAERVSDTEGLVLPAGSRPRLVWLNSPANPSGRVHSPAELAAAVGWARAHEAIVVSDECYLDLGYDTTPTSVLHPQVCGGSHAGLLAVHSLSKRSNLAGYRAGFVAGDPALVADLLALRKHAGLIVAGPVQDAMVAAYGDESHVDTQRARYAARREQLRNALQGAGFRIDDSAAGLYLWATRGEDSQATVRWLAERGILVAPGSFYGPAGGQHVRVALTATDERVAAAVGRLARG